MSADTVPDLNATLKAAMKKDGRENEKRRIKAELTHEILLSEDSPEIKVMRLHTECGFGTRNWCMEHQNLRSPIRTKKFLKM